MRTLQVSYLTPMWYTYVEQWATFKNHIPGNILCYIRVFAQLINVVRYVLTIHHIFSTYLTPPSSYHWPLSTYFYICYIPTHTCSYTQVKARWNEEGSNYTGQITLVLIHPQLRHNKFQNGSYIVGAGSHNPKFNSNKSRVEQLGRRGWIFSPPFPHPKTGGEYRSTLCCK